MLSNLRSFILGFDYGRRVRVELSAREIGDQWPDVDTDSFVQGMLDGIADDRFRMGLSKEFGT